MGKKQRDHVITMRTHQLHRVIRDLELSRHFSERWSQRVANGIQPRLPAIKSILAQSVVIQRGREVLKSNGRKFRTLTLCWHPKLEIIISIDPVEARAVSVLSGDCVSYHM